jgi:hypothetical protein
VDFRGFFLVQLGLLATAEAAKAATRSGFKGESEVSMLMREREEHSWDR